jgi:transposase
VLLPHQQAMLVRGTKDIEPVMTDTPKHSIAFVGIDIGKNSFHVVGLDECGAIVLRQKWSRGQVEARFANMPRCLIGMEACVGAHHLSWPRCPVDACEIRSPLFEGTEKRPP